MYFENEMQVQINGTTFSDSIKLVNHGSVKIENDVNRSSVTTYSYLAATSGGTTTHTATPGQLNPWQGQYQKIFTPHYIPKIIYRGENDDVSVEAIGVNYVEDPFPGSEYLALGELHFLQYDIDQAYNYLIHSPIPVR